MNEVSYSRKYSKRWRHFDAYLKQKNKQDPSELEKLYVELMDDLAYAKTNFPDSKTTAYLNQLAMRAHQALYKRNKYEGKKLFDFYKFKYPLLIYNYRKQILYSFLFLIISAATGALSTHHDENFVRLILGDHYVNQTIENIKEGNPMGVYESMKPLPMFFRIAWNNIRVSFSIFAAGVVFTFGTIFLLFSNGLMIGTFQYYFLQQNLLGVSAQTIWLHGTIEIFSVVIAGAAGLIIGKSLMFPGTYKRLTSFQKGAKDGMLLIAGLIPFFLLAAFIESFITRHYQASSMINILIISLSLIFIFYYFIIYPLIIKKKQSYEQPKPNTQA